MNKVIIIAEAGVNHNGDINIAKKLIEAAKDAGADYVKFQTWITEDLIDINAPKAAYQIENDGSMTSQYEMLKKLELSFDDFRVLKSYAEEIDIQFLSTPDEVKSLDFLVDELNLPVIKVGSGEVTNIPYLKKIGAKKRDVILSTGMSNLAEVEKAYKTLLDSGARSITLLHCTSNYPAPYDSINLRAMKFLQNHFNCRVGYSDHTEGSEVSIAAVALGASIIEKHFTLNKKLPGPDHKASLDIAELKNFVRQIRNTEKALSGTGKKEIQISEIETKKVVTKGIYLDKDVQKGDLITDEMLIMKRPVVGINAMMYDQLIGKKITIDLKKGTALTTTHFE